MWMMMIMTISKMMMMWNGIQMVINHNDGVKKDVIDDNRD